MERTTETQKNEGESESGAQIEAKRENAQKTYFLADHHLFDFNNSDIVWAGQFELGSALSTFGPDLRVAQGVRVQTGSDFEVSASSSSAQTAFFVWESQNALTLRDVSVNVDVSSSGSVAGLVGVAQDELRVKNASASGRISGNDAAGLVLSSETLFYGLEVSSDATVRGQRTAQLCLEAKGTF